MNVIDFIILFSEKWINTGSTLTETSDRKKKKEETEVSAEVNFSPKSSDFKSRPKVVLRR